MKKYFYYPHTQENRITEDTKLLIGIGDSFCAGRGACSIEIWEKYGWDMERMYGEGKGEVEIVFLCERNISTRNFRIFLSKSENFICG